MQRDIYLLNNKTKEPQFESSFIKRIRREGHRAYSISIKNMAFFCPRDGAVAVYNGDKKLTLTAWSRFFIRSWNPYGQATSLLCFILKDMRIPFTDALMNTAHSIKSSKLAHAFLLHPHGISSPATWVVPLLSFEKHRKKITSSLQFPMVVKAMGGLGKRVWLCKSDTALLRQIRVLKKENVDQLVLLQEYVENQSDIRIIVFQGRVLGSIERSAVDGFLNNVSQGGNARPVTVTAREKQIAIRAAKVLGLDLAGVDIVRTVHGPLIFEVNKAPDITSFDEAVGFDLADKIAQAFAAH